MSRIVIDFATDNDAFRSDDGELEYEGLKEFLETSARRIPLMGRTKGRTTRHSLRDVFGNTVGYVLIEEDK